MGENSKFQKVSRNSNLFNSLRMPLMVNKLSRKKKLISVHENHPEESSNSGNYQRQNQPESGGLEESLASSSILAGNLGHPRTSVQFNDLSSLLLGSQGDCQSWRRLESTHLHHLTPNDISLMTDDGQDNMTEDLTNYYSAKGSSVLEEQTGYKQESFVTAKQNVDTSSSSGTPTNASSRSKMTASVLFSLDKRKSVVPFRANQRPILVQGSSDEESDDTQEVNRPKLRRSMLGRHPVLLLPDSDDDEGKENQVENWVATSPFSSPTAPRKLSNFETDDDSPGSKTVYDRCLEVSSDRSSKQFLSQDLRTTSSEGTNQSDYSSKRFVDEKDSSVQVSISSGSESDDESQPSETTVQGSDTDDSKQETPQKRNVSINVDLSQEENETQSTSDDTNHDEDHNESRRTIELDEEENNSKNDNDNSVIIISDDEEEDKSPVIETRDAAISANFSDSDEDSKFTEKEYLKQTRNSIGQQDGMQEVSETDKSLSYSMSTLALSESKSLQQNNSVNDDESFSFLTKKKKPTLISSSEDESFDIDKKNSQKSPQKKSAYSMSTLILSESLNEKENANDSSIDLDSPIFSIKKKKPLVLSSSEDEESTSPSSKGKNDSIKKPPKATYINSSNEISETSLETSKESTNFRTKKVLDFSSDEDSDSPIAKPKPRNLPPIFSHSEDSDDDFKVKKKPPVKPPTSVTKRTKKEVKTPKVTFTKKTQPEKVPHLTFLQSLCFTQKDVRCHPQAMKYITHYSSHKEELARKLFHIFNTEVFFLSLDPETPINWSVKLLTTAGTCVQKKRTFKGEVTRFCEINLSTKVLDSADRLRDTLIHEMCHAACWIISGYNGGHGPLWKDWAKRAMVRFPELSVLSRCHSYAIRTKYTYRCEKCGQEIHRHSKSLDTDRKVCGKCGGRFMLFLNKKGSVAGMTPGRRLEPTTPKAPNAFALFVKENYKTVRTPGSSHKDAMKELSKKFSEAKIKK